MNLNISPNPFHSSTILAYDLDKNASVNVSLYDITGRLIALVLDENQGQGKYRFDINAENYRLNSGVYILQMKFGDQLVSKQLIKY